MMQKKKSLKGEDNYLVLERVDKPQATIAAYCHGWLVRRRRVRTGVCRAVKPMFAGRERAVRVGIRAQSANMMLLFGGVVT